MLPTYPAILTNSRLEWIGDGPAGLAGSVRVQVMIEDPQLAQSRDQGARMAAALEAIARRGGLAAITDPLKWEREQREDRDLPGRAE